MRRIYRTLTASVLALALLAGSAMLIPTVRAAEVAESSDSASESAEPSSSETPAATESTETTATEPATSSEEVTTTEAATYTITLMVEGISAAVNGKSDLTKVKEKDTIEIFFDESLVGDNEVVSWSLSANGNPVSYQIEEPEKCTKIKITMPAANLSVGARVEVDEEKESSSIEESKSIAESEYAAKKSSEEERQSIYESSSIEASKKASAEASEYAAQTIQVGTYEVYLHMSSTVAPEKFVLANDTTSFSETVECFYSSSYKVYAYYAKKNGESNYYLYNKLNGDMMPFVTFSGAGGRSYVVMAPDSEIELPDEIIANTNVNLNELTQSESAIIVPAWTALDADGGDHTLLYLGCDDGSRGYYVYDTSSGAVTLTDWNRYLDGETDAEKVTELETEVKETEAAETEASTTAAVAKKGKSLKSYVIWLIIIGVIIVLLITAIIVVFFMSKQQEAEEAALDEDEEDDTDDGDDETDESDDRLPGSYGSSYAKPEVDDLEPFDIDFEDAFPEEMGIGAPEKQTAARGRVRGTFGGAAAKTPTDNSGLNDFLSEDDFEVIDFSRKD